MSAHPKIVARCDTPYSLRLFTFSFRSFSPTPGAMEFKPGKDYYFISTSSKRDLANRFKGMCYTHNMKVVFKVAPLDSQEPETTTRLITQDENTILDHIDKVREKKKRRKNRRKKKRRKQHQHEQHEETLAEDLKPQKLPPPILKEQEPSMVAKVNDLMNQQASIGAAFSPSSPSSTESTGSLISFTVQVVLSMAFAKLLT